MIHNYHPDFQPFSDFIMTTNTTSPPKLLDQVRERLKRMRDEGLGRNFWHNPVSGQSHRRRLVKHPARPETNAPINATMGKHRNIG
ncbi:MAG: hypothetical protein LBQ81_09175 [Zoogloeaceae bacterium]|jgi:hypothetical protein|nr:hypothetical protein [Zoogloeaceae bacterium]